MDLLYAMSTLRAVRRLRPDPVPDDVLERVLTAATWAPTGGNVQPFRMVLVRDRERMAALGECYAARWFAYARDHRERIARAPEDPEHVRLARTLDAGDHLAEHFASVPALVVFCFDHRRMAITDADLGRPSVVGGGSVYPAVQNLLLAARAEGLGCVLTTLLCMDEPRVREVLGIPEPWATAGHVPLGWPVGGGHGPIRRRPLEQLTHQDRWGTPWPVRREAAEPEDDGDPEDS
jgi:nitroreductase